MSDEIQNMHKAPLPRVLKRELDTDEDEEIIPCTVCSKEFASRVALRNHMRNMHTDANAQMPIEPEEIKQETCSSKPITVPQVNPDKLEGVNSSMETIVVKPEEIKQEPCSSKPITVPQVNPDKLEGVNSSMETIVVKDARQKAMVHPAFDNAGMQAGVEVWRIENFDPVPVPAKDLGKFYKGDSYVVLKTTSEKRNNLSWDIHYWIGSQSSTDEAAAAAILTVGLDGKFHGAAVQHRESMGHESHQFLGYFQPAIRYVDGGHASGLNHVTTNAGAEKRLFQVKGKRNVRVRQVDASIASMNRGDCFILDVHHNIYVYVGETATNVEKLKASSVASQIRDQDHNGRARVELTDQYSNEADVQKFFTALGSGSRDTVPEESAGGDDQAFERSEEQSVVLSEISDASGQLNVTPLAKPYKQEQLKPQECYILDTVSGSIYVWVGKQSTERERNDAMTIAQQYLSAKNYPAWVHVARIPQGTEPAVFKQYFSTWRDVGMAHNMLMRFISDDEMSPK